ncbi:MAG TPA: HAD family hydrolase [Acetobacteraceae bacterium]|nr:HAD family hydrolase [Acetobacteraceae bacterium]
MRIRAVCFDVGETLIDETRHWGEWADFLGVPRLTLFATLGMTMARGESHRRVFDLFRPDLDLATARKLRHAQGWRYDFVAEDLYPDAIPCLAELRERGIKVLVAGNQPIEAEAALERIGLPADVIASSAGWGVAKPDAEFFARIVAAAGEPAHRVAYVGDRLDNDVLPARAAGMFAVFLRRGPWGWLHAEHPDIAQADLRLDDLTRLPDALASL